MSWLDSEEVQRLRKVYNQEHPKEDPVPEGTDEEMWANIQHRLSDKCSTGSAECIVSSLMQRPRAPKEWAIKRNEWLSSDDIDRVEKNYTKLFAKYFFVGCIPIDFDIKNETQECVVSALCKMKLPELVKKGHEQIGIVFNTDPHDGPGEHWIALFCDIRKVLEYPRITYFDSYAHAPEKEIKVLMKRWKSQWDETGVHSQPMKMTFNATRHQFKDSECGMYCLYFHRACLMEQPMESRIPDDVINGFRQLLFRVPKIETGKK
jgi:hypothetical protein